MKRFNTKIAVGFCLLSLAGGACASMDSVMTQTNTMPDEVQRKELVGQAGDLTPKQREQFLAGQPWIGMTQAQLNTLMGGAPKKKQSKLTAAGPEEYQIYAARVGNWKTGVVTKYWKAKMADGKLAEIQELDKYDGNLEKY